MSKNGFLFDADSLIVAKRHHYSPDFCPAFWDWIVEGNKNSLFFTIDRVADEFKQGSDGDYLYEFIETHHRSFVLKTKNDPGCMAKYGQIQAWAAATWANGKSPNKIAKALETFAKEKTADPWLVALASAKNFSIISNEASAPESQTIVKLPDVANAFGVKVFKLHEVLALHSGKNFSFKRT